MVQVSLLCQWYLTKLFGEIFLWYKSDTSCAMSMIFHEVSWWDISMVKVIQVIQLIQVHLWHDFQVFFILLLIGFQLLTRSFCKTKSWPNNCLNSRLTCRLQAGLGSGGSARIVIMNCIYINCNCGYDGETPKIKRASSISVDSFWPRSTLGHVLA